MTPMPAAKPSTLGAGGRKAASSMPTDAYLRSVGKCPCSLAYISTKLASCNAVAECSVGHKQKD